MARMDRLIIGGMRAASDASPGLGGRLALRVFFTTSPRMPIRAADSATDLLAHRSALRVRGHRVVVYRWGEGERTALLLHGWRGRSSQFAPLIRELVAEGFRVTAFDAPAHGASGGRRTDIRDWLEAIRLLDTDGHGFDLVVGHSFGALAALTAVRDGMRADAVAAISGAASPRAFLGQFSRGIGLGEATAQKFEERFRARLGIDEEQMDARYDAVAHPLPDDVDLLVVHDRQDQLMPDSDSLRLHAAHGARSRLLRTDGLGHSRVLAADPVLDAVVELAVGVAEEKRSIRGR